MTNLLHIPLCINRNIVECKVTLLPGSTGCHDRSINRNIVECKVSKPPFITSLTLVLIETLWNVKSATISSIFASISGINRNIVECKVPGTGRLCKTKHRINRNIVECKVASSSYSTPKILVLIETLWNVKREGYNAFSPGLEGINRNIVECKGRNHS